MVLERVSKREREKDRERVRCSGSKLLEKCIEKN